MLFEKKFAHMASGCAHRERENPESPVTADEKSYLNGAEVYKENCAVCHGLPDQPKTNIAQGMYPPPPQLFHGTGVSDDPSVGNLLEGGEWHSFDGHAGFKGRLTETQIWEVSVLLANSDKLPASVKAALAPCACGPDIPPAGGLRHLAPKQSHKPLIHFSRFSRHAWIEITARAEPSRRAAWQRMDLLDFSQLRETPRPDGSHDECANSANHDGGELFRTIAR